MNELEGPRGARKEEVEALKELNVSCFPHPPATPNCAYLMFAEENLDHQRIFLHQGRPVSLVGVVPLEAEIFSCPVKVALVGLVCTHQDFRGQGLSSRLLEDAWNKLHAEGVDFALISGNRPLYWRAGGGACRPSYIFRIAPGEEGIKRRIAFDFLPHLEKISQIYQAESVHFRRSPEMLRDILQARLVGLRPKMPAEKHMVFAMIEQRAYLVGWRAECEGDVPHIVVVEYAGDRSLLAEAAPALAARWLAPLSFEVPFWEETFRAKLAKIGEVKYFRTASGTIKMLNLPQFMEKLRPLWEKGLIAEQKAIAFSQSGDQAKIVLGGEGLVVQGQAMAELVFGTIEERSWAADKPALGVTLKSIFPLPGIRYDLDYV